MTKILQACFKYLRFYGGKYRCIICGRPVRTFFPFSKDLQREAKDNGFLYDFKLMETLNWAQCNCPFCMSIDRERFYFIYLQHYFKMTRLTSYNILDFAPSKMFADRVSSIPSVTYTSADLFRNDVDLQLDICNMDQIKDGTYDIIICSHVLEHVESPEDAISGLFRVLKNDSIAIVMVPLFWDVKETIELVDDGSPQSRSKFYGQADHIRLFAKEDFVKRLQTGGFVVQEVLPQALDTRLIQENGISDNSILYVCAKSKSTHD